MKTNRVKLCAFSGGADSTAMVVRLFESGEKIAAAHFNHCLRGAESDGDEAFCREFCAQRGIPFFAGGQSVKNEADARNKRYAFLSAIRAEHGFCGIYTAHNADDAAETLLLNLIRGTGLDGLTGIRDREHIKRPFINLTHADNENFLRERGIQWREDSTNAADGHRRNRVRNQIMPLLKAENPKIVGTLCRTAEILRRDAELLDALAETEFSSELPVPVQARIVKRMCGVDIGHAHIDAVLALFDGKNGTKSVNLPHNLIARNEYGKLIIEPKIRSGFAPVALKTYAETPVRIPELGLLVFFTRDFGKINNLVYSFSLKCDRIEEVWIVRQREPGDKIRIVGRNCTKKLQDLFCDAKIPKFERDNVPVVCNADGVIALGGFGVAERAAGDDIRLVFAKEF